MVALCSTAIVNATRSTNFESKPLPSSGSHNSTKLESVMYSAIASGVDTTPFTYAAKALDTCDIVSCSPVAAVETLRSEHQRCQLLYILPDKAFSHGPTIASQWTPSITTVLTIIFGVLGAVLGIWTILLIRKKAVEDIGTQGFPRLKP